MFFNLLFSGISVLLRSSAFTDAPPGAVKAVFNKLQKSLGKTHAFACLSPVILADCGVEFGNPDSRNASPERIRHTSIYYCDPGAAARRPVLKIYIPYCV